MEKIRVGINGFGRIGRTLFRVLLERKSIEVVAINDIANLRSLAHLLKYDSIHGVLNAKITFSESTLNVDGSDIHFSQERQIENILWNDCDFVVEATGSFFSASKLKSHLISGTKKVILASPPSSEETKMIVLGVNDHLLSFNDNIVSNASCTSNSAAPMVQLIDDNFGVEQAYITTIHSYTKDQSLHDSPHKDLRRARAGALSIIPTTTGAAKALSKIFPHLEIGGCGMRVPVPNGSLTDITFTVKSECSIQEVNELFYKASRGSHLGILSYTDEPIVSSDVIGNPASCLFDSQLTSVLGKMVKIVSWYDNETGYSNRLADLIEKMSLKD
jgi:glyceraldehyde 3-phosphate dehydrogenase